MQLAEKLMRGLDFAILEGFFRNYFLRDKVWHLEPTRRGSGRERFLHRHGIEGRYRAMQ